jgi:hypothetical protein
LLLILAKLKLVERPAANLIAVYIFGRILRHNPSRGSDLSCLTLQTRHSYSATAFTAKFSP